MLIFNDWPTGQQSKITCLILWVLEIAQDVVDSMGVRDGPGCGWFYGCEKASCHSF